MPGWRSSAPGAGANATRWFRALVLRLGSTDTRRRLRVRSQPHEARCRRSEARHRRSARRRVAVLRDQSCVDGTALLLAVVVRACAPRREAETSIGASWGPNESVTPCSNQQIIPALQPVNSTPCCQASRKISSKPCVLQIARALAVFPPVTTITSWSSVSCLSPEGGQGKKCRCVISARPRSRSYNRGSSVVTMPPVVCQMAAFPARGRARTRAVSRLGPAHRNDCRLRHNAEYCRICERIPACPSATSTTSTSLRRGGRELLGGRGSGLAEMTQMGVPVPPGSRSRPTPAARTCRMARPCRTGGREIEQHLGALELKTGKRFGT